MYVRVAIHRSNLSRSRQSRLAEEQELLLKSDRSGELLTSHAMSGPLLNIPRTGNRRKNIPTLPSSAFDTSNPIPAPGKTPLPPSPSKIHPSVVIDSRVSISSLEDAEKWKATEDNKLESSILSLDFPNLDDGVEAVDKSAVLFFHNNLLMRRSTG